MPKKKFFSLLKDSFKDMRIASPSYFKKITWTDRVLDFSVLRFIPEWMTPNHFTILRFLSIPLIIALLLGEYVEIGIVLFILSAFSDAVDGALARTRNKVTKWGIVNDPLADKMLIGSVVAIMVSKYIHPFLAFAVIGLEIIIFSAALYKTRYGGKIVPAKMVGKIKMILESIALIFVFIFAISGVGIYLTIGTILLYVAIFFALLSLFVYKSI